MTKQIITQNPKTLSSNVKAFFWLWLAPLAALIIIPLLMGNFESVLYWKFNIFLAVFFSISAATNGFLVPLLSRNFSIFKSVFIGMLVVLLLSFLYDAQFALHFRDLKYQNIQVSVIRSILNASVFVLGHFSIRLFSRQKSERDFNLPKSASFYKKIVLWISVPQGLLIGFIFVTESLHKSSSLDNIVYVLGALGYSLLTTGTAVLAVFLLTRFSFLKSETAVLVAATTVLCVLAGSAFSMATLDRFTLTSALVTVVFPSFFTASGVIFLLLHFNSDAAKNKTINALDRSFRKQYSELRYLKQQTNPHFFFNNLNMLISLIESDPQKAAVFGKQLANVYRKFLKADDVDFVSISDEIEFISEYLEIYKAKFGASVSISIDVNSDGFLLANSLQEIIDNIFKHNVLSDENPIEISIFSTDDYLIVRNSTRPKIAEHSDKKGLSNILRRHELLVDLPFIVNAETTFFEVKLPILKSE
ncbi:MAG: hypothetical protein EOO50_02200 [Flavobacterium sp.]|uniref:sensor histidine kinase n=1 Tax=Flavobacterium sp. TaxID=239 RepID=UPI001229F982|nr:histidine kinase [Flavobacterium sp.]RZJ68252.1 MAG: hypothetical protein EOO50_02200 [Flavobacterium sp.]